MAFDGNNATHINVLKTERQNDPRGYGYAAADVPTNNDQAIANLLNTVRNGTNPPASPTAVAPVFGGSPAVPGGTTAAGNADGHITIKRPDCMPNEILEAIDIRDFPASPAGVNNVPLCQSWLESITQFAKVRLSNDDGTKTQTRKNIDRLVNDTQGSQTRLDAVAVRNGSRLEEIFGAGSVCTADHVSATR